MSQPSWIGQTLGGRYRIEEILGKGGMSAVYKAMDPNLRRVVAIKLIHPHLSDNPKFLSRFEEEAAAVAQLRHSNIVQVYDFNHDGDVYYMVMEFVPGETLQDRLRRTNKAGWRLPLADALQFAIHICKAVNYAHTRGMIHRDIKPANVMLDVHNQAILMDFGIVKIMGGQKHTATGAVIGTALYMSPEQIRGETPDERSDIYSLGVTLFEMVSGRPPYEAESAMTLMMMHLNDPIPDMHGLRPEVPEDLIAVIEKALSKDRAHRYQSAAHMAADLQKVLDRLQGDVPDVATITEEPAIASDLTPGPLEPAKTVEPPAPISMSFDQPASGGVSAPAGAPPGLEAPLANSGAAGTFVEPQLAGNLPGSGQAPTRRAAEPPAAGPPKRSMQPALLAGAAGLLIVLVCLFAGGIFLFNQVAGGRENPPAALVPAPTDTVSVVALVNTPLPAEVVAPEATNTPPAPPTATLSPTNTLPPSPTPTATVPYGIPFVRINGITIDDQNRYVVEYETFEYTEQLPGVHVHFFFNTVPPDQAGVPGRGPWILYGGPRPFTGYKVSDRPQDATQICTLVADADHSVQPGSGMCMDLPAY